MNLDKRRQQPAKIHGFHFAPGELGIEPRRVRDIADQPVKTLHVVLDDVHQGCLLCRIAHAGHGFDSAAQRGQRVFDFMSHIGGKTFIRLDTLPERLGHIAERGGQIANLVPPARKIGNLVGFTMAMPHPVGRRGKPAHGPGYRIGQIQRQHHCQCENDGKHFEDIEPDSPDGGIDIVGVRCQQNSTQHLLEPLDRRDRAEQHPAGFIRPARGTNPSVKRGHRNRQIGSPERHRTGKRRQPFAGRQKGDKQVVNAVEHCRRRIAAVGRRQGLDLHGTALPGQEQAVGNFRPVGGENAGACPCRSRQAPQHGPCHIWQNKLRTIGTCTDRALAQRPGENFGLGFERRKLRHNQSFAVLVKIQDPGDENRQWQDIHNQDTPCQRRQKPAGHRSFL